MKFEADSTPVTLQLGTLDKKTYPQSMMPKIGSELLGNAQNPQAKQSKVGTDQVPDELEYARVEDAMVTGKLTIKLDGSVATKTFKSGDTIKVDEKSFGKESGTIVYFTQGNETKKGYVASEDILNKTWGIYYDYDGQKERWYMRAQEKISGYHLFAATDPYIDISPIDDNGKPRDGSGSIWIYRQDRNGEMKGVRPLEAGENFFCEPNWRTLPDNKVKMYYSENGWLKFGYVDRERLLRQQEIGNGQANPF